MFPLVCPFLMGKDFHRWEVVSHDQPLVCGMMVCWTTYSELVSSPSAFLSIGLILKAHTISNKLVSKVFAQKKGGKM